MLLCRILAGDGLLIQDSSRYATRRLKILFTNLVLRGRSGTETLTRDVVLALRRRGHSVAVFAPHIGRIAAEIRATGTPVVNSLADLPEIPDIIHGQHTGPTLAALLRFPGTPAVFVCHDFSSEHDDPPAHPRICKYLYVRDTLRGRVVDECGIPPSKTAFWPNTVDLVRIGEFVRPRKKVLKAAIFAYPDSIPFAPTLNHVCVARGIGFDSALLSSLSDHPIRLLRGVDLVFASGRMALEALAAGCAVINADRYGLGGLVTMKRLPAFIRANFAMGALSNAPTIGAIETELASYDPDDAAEVAEYIRSNFNSDRGAELIEDQYAEVLAQRTWNSVVPSEENIATARLVETYLQDMRVYDPAFVHRRRGTDIPPHIESAVSELIETTAQLMSEIRTLREENVDLPTAVGRNLWHRLRRSAQKRKNIKPLHS